MPKEKLFSLSELGPTLRSSGGRTLILIIALLIIGMEIGRSGIFRLALGKLDKRGNDVFLVNRSRTRSLAFTVRKTDWNWEGDNDDPETKVFKLPPGAEIDIGSLRYKNISGETAGYHKFKVVGA